MKINETFTTTSTDPVGNQSQQAPHFGRSNKVLEKKDKVEETSAGATGSGSIATVSNPIGGIKSRGSIFSGVKTSSKYPNSRKAGIKENKEVEEGRYYNRDAYQRDYDSSRTGFGRRGREDDEYVNGPDKLTYKVRILVINPEGAEEDRTVTITTAKGPEFAKTRSIKHLTDKGYKIRKVFDPVESGLNEDDEPEGETLKNSLHTIVRVASDLDERLSVDEDFPEWVSEKIGTVKSMLVSVMDYLISDQEMRHDPDAMNESGGRTVYDMDKEYGAPAQRHKPVIARGSSSRYDPDAVDPMHRDQRRFQADQDRYLQAQRDAIAKMKAEKGLEEGSDELYQKAIHKYAQRVADDYLGGGNEYLYGANKFDSEMFGVDPKQAQQDFKTLFAQLTKQQGVAEGLDGRASATPAINKRGKFTSWDENEPMRLKCQDGEFRTIQEINVLRQKMGMKPFSIKGEQGVAEGSENFTITQKKDQSYPGSLQVVITDKSTGKQKVIAGDPRKIKQQIKQEFGIDYNFSQQGVAEGRVLHRDLKSWTDDAKSQGLNVIKPKNDLEWTHHATDKTGKVCGKFCTTNVPQNSRGFIHKQGVAEGSLKEFAVEPSDGGDDDEYDLLVKLVKLWWLGTAQQHAKAEKTLASMGISIEEDDPNIILRRGKQFLTFPMDDFQQGVAEGSGGDWYAMALKRHPQLKQVDREKVIDALNDAYEDYLFDYGYEGIGPDEESSLIDYAVKRLKQGVAEGTSTGDPVYIEGCEWDDVVGWLVKNVGPLTKKNPNYAQGWEGRGWILYPTNRTDEEGLEVLQLSANTKLANKQVLAKSIQMACSGQQGVAEATLDEKSKSKAQFRMMAAVAHNPKFAKKVGISRSVGKEFHNADKHQNYKKLPSKVDEAEVSEDKLANDLYKDLQIFKKGTDKDIGGKAKDKEISSKAKDKEIQKKK